MVSDAELIARCLAGDRAAFDEIVRRYQDALFRHLFRLAGNREQAEDLCQEAFLRLYRALPSFQRHRPLAPFLLKIATNLWRDGRPRPVLLAEVPAVESRHPEQVALQNLEREAIRRAMAGLRPEYREVLSLRYDQGLSYREIAEVTGTSAGTVATWLHRAVEALRHTLTHSVEQEVAP